MDELLDSGTGTLRIRETYNPVGRAMFLVSAAVIAGFAVFSGYGVMDLHSSGESIFVSRSSPTPSVTTRSTPTTTTSPNASGSGGYGFSLVFAYAVYVVAALHAYLAITAVAAAVLAGGAFIAAATLITKTSWFWNGANVNGLTAIENDRFVSQLAADLAS